VFVDIGGATASSYTLVSADAPNKVRAVVTGTNAGGSLSAASNALGPVTNGIDAFTVLMLHCDGTNGSTTITDSSTAAHTMSASGNAHISTAQFKFGTASLSCDGAGDWVQSADSADWNFGSGDFTIDCWVRFSSLASGLGGYVAQFTQTGNQRSFKFEYNVFVGGNILDYSTDGTNEAYQAGTWTPSTDTWYHVATVRSGANLYQFVDGTQVGTTHNIGVSTLFDSSGPLTVGYSDPGTGNSPLNGWIDEVRVSKGIARWTSNFTPPTAPYS
jgi:hypothetical protein